MIRRLLARLLPKARRRDPVVYPRDKHPIRREQISPAARQVVERLQQAGFKAFVVGGAVRDLMFGIAPKDFDIATDATPEQVKPLFRRAFIIGRRFRLVHVLSGHETTEVSTFRALSAETQADEHGRLVSDNVFGSQYEDAFRRDFTMNALYFDPVSEEVWDYVGGVRDVRARRLRLIGPPVTRYREDPVRMLRAVRLAAKVGAEIEPKTAEPIPRHADLLGNVPPARVYDEMQKLLLSGHAVETLKSLRAHGLHHGVLPMLDAIVEQPLGHRFVDLALRGTDERIRAGKTVSPGFLFATLFWHDVLAQWVRRRESGEKPFPALMAAMDAVLESVAEQLAIPRRFTSTIIEIWGLQPRFEQRSGQRPFRLLEHPRFRAGLDFLHLRCRSGEQPAELFEWWRDFERADDETRATMLRTDEAPKRRRRRRGGRRTDGGDRSADRAEGEDRADAVGQPTGAPE
jgi:poly(A) polymerase